MRYLKPMMLQERVMHERLARLSHVDYDREIALVAETTDDQGERLLMGVIRLSRIHATNEARLSILVGDPYQGIGLGGELVRRAVEVARSEHMSRLNAILTADNQRMIQIFEKLGFHLQPVENEKLMTAIIEL
jgi:acetyltransferase